MDVIHVTNRVEIGPLGEDIAEKYLWKEGFSIVDRNFRRPYGEIDIVARKGGRLHFCEVKAVICEIETSDKNFPPPPPDADPPEERIHKKKLLRLARAIQAYLARHGDDLEWQFDVIAVFVDPVKKKALVRMTEDVALAS